MSQQKVLIIEDDKDMSEIISLYLTKNGFRCLQAFDGNAAVAEARENYPDVIILDVQLPGINGIEVCRTLRQETDIPILFLSCCAEEQDKICGLEAGGDDYIAKPFSLPELHARVKAALRRRGLPDTPGMPKQLLTFRGLKIDLAKGLVLVDDAVIDIPQMEYQLLVRLARNPGWPFSTGQLFTLIWGAESIDTRTVAVHINRLRKRLDQNAGRHEYIITVWGKGYKFNDQL